MLPKTSGYVKSHDGKTKWMYFLIEDDDIVKKHNAIWYKVSSDFRKEFGSEPICNKESLRTKIKSHGDEVTDFFEKEIPKVHSNHTCLAVTSSDSALKKDESYYFQVFLKEFKYIKKKPIRLTIDDLESSLDDCDDSHEE